jgi:hypothetical protein
MHTVNSLRQLLSILHDLLLDGIRLLLLSSRSKAALNLSQVSSGLSGDVHAGNILSNELPPVLKDEFDLNGAPITIHLTRNEKSNVTGFAVYGFGPEIERRKP